MKTFQEYLSLKEADVTQNRDAIRSPGGKNFYTGKPNDRPTYGRQPANFNYPLPNQATGKELRPHGFMGVGPEEMKPDNLTPSKKAYGVESNEKRPIYAHDEDLRGGMLFWANENEKSRKGRKFIAFTDTPQAKQVLNALSTSHARQFSFAYQNQLNDLFRWSDGQDTMPEEQVFEYHPEAKYGSVANKAVASKYEPNSPYHGTPEYDLDKLNKR